MSCDNASTAAGSATPAAGRAKASLKKRLFGSNIKFHKTLKS